MILRRRSLLATLLLVVAMAASSSSSSSSSSGYDQVCFVDPELSQEFPMLTTPPPLHGDGNRSRSRSRSHSRNLRITGSDDHYLKAVLLDDEDSQHSRDVPTKQHRRTMTLLDDDDEAEEETTTTTTTTTTMVPLYRCICDNMDFQDARTTHSYCPLGFACGIPADDPDAPADCVSSEGAAMDGVARMAWPISLFSALCLVLVVSGTWYGVALKRYLDKQQYCCCTRRKTTRTGDNDDSLLERYEQEEVDELLQALASRQEHQQENDGEVLVPPSRCRQWKEFQLFQYHTTILEPAQVGFRREWNNYRKEMAAAPIQLYLATKRVVAVQHSSDDGSDMNMTAASSTESSRSTTPATDDHNDDADADDDSSITTCSICFAEIHIGQRIGDLPCGHDIEFHASCLKTWIATGRRNTCPLCQAPNIAARSRSELMIRGRARLCLQQHQQQKNATGTNTTDDNDDGEKEEKEKVTTTTRNRSESIPSESTSSLTLPSSSEQEEVDEEESAADSNGDDEDGTRQILRNEGGGGEEEEGETYEHHGRRAFP